MNIKNQLKEERIVHRLKSQLPLRVSAIYGVDQCGF